MVRPFEKPHGRLPRRPLVPSSSRNHHERSCFPAHPEPVEGRASAVQSPSPASKESLKIGLFNRSFIDDCLDVFDDIDRKRFAAIPHR